MHGTENSPVILDGEKAAWGIVNSLNPDDVRRRAKVLFDVKEETFTMKMFSASIVVSLPKRLIFGLDRQNRRFLNSLGDHAILAALRYLIHAAEAPFSGNFINPAELTGGHIYRNGSHVLPLHLIAQKYGSDREGFLARGRFLGGEQTSRGDASLVLLPFPRIAVAVILWLQDDEFPARSVLLVDSSCEQQMPPDVMWMTAMMCVLAMTLSPDF